MYTVLVNKPIHPDAAELLRREVQLLEAYDAAPLEIEKLLPTLDGIILCAGFSMGPDQMDKGKRLRVIGRHGVGLDIIDVKAASERGLPVVYTPLGPTESTAEHAL